MPSYTHTKTMEVPGSISLSVPPGAKTKKPFCNNAKNRLILIACGAFVGFLVCMSYISWLIVSKMLMSSGINQSAQITTQQQNHSVLTEEEIFPVLNEQPIKSIERDALYIGIFTLLPYLDTRAKACNTTWTSNPEVTHLDIYAELSSEEDQLHQLPVVPIQGRKSEDTWHTEKSFIMLEQMCDQHVDRFDWFMRAVDDSYVDVSRLQQLLDRLDKSKQMMLGHPTLPIDDASFKALNGREYCLGGPGLVFSRPLMKNICPHLPICRESYSDLPADVAIARCVSEFTGVECAFLPKLHDFFVHSYEKNQFHLLDEFEQLASTGITYHPLKQPWMMHAMHHKITSRQLATTKLHLESLKSHRTVLQNRIHDIATPQSRTSSEQIFEDKTTLISDDGYGFKAGSLAAKFKLTENEISTFQQAKRLANTSISWGHGQKCSSVLSGLNIDLPHNKLHIVDMACQDRKDNNHTLSRTVISQPLGNLNVQKVRSWRAPKEIIITLHVQLDDPKLLSFLIDLRQAMAKSDKIIILNILYRSNRKGKHNYSYEVLINDLLSWANAYDIIINARAIKDTTKSINRLYYESIQTLSTYYKDAIVLISDIDSKFNHNFLERCVALTKEGHQMYMPHLNNNIMLQGKGHNLHENIANRAKDCNRPVCIHIKDYVGVRKGRRQRKMLSARQPLLINSAIDYDYASTITYDT